MPDRSSLEKWKRRKSKQRRAWRLKKSRRNIRRMWHKLRHFSEREGEQCGGNEVQVTFEYHEFELQESANVKELQLRQINPHVVQGSTVMKTGCLFLKIPPVFQKKLLVWVNPRQGTFFTALKVCLYIHPLLIVHMEGCCWVMGDSLCHSSVHWDQYQQPLK